MNEIGLQNNMNFETAVTPDYKLFSAVQIFEGIIGGSIFTGQLMLALNCAKLKDAKRANRKLFLSLVWLVFLAMIPQLYLLVSICFIFIFYSEFKRRQKIEYAVHLSRGGSRCCHWDVLALCFLSNIIYYLLSMIIRIVFYYAIS